MSPENWNNNHFITILSKTEAFISVYSTLYMLVLLICWHSIQIWAALKWKGPCETDSWYYFSKNSLKDFFKHDADMPSKISFVWDWTEDVPGGKFSCQQNGTFKWRSKKSSRKKWAQFKVNVQQCGVCSHDKEPFETTNLRTKRQLGPNTELVLWTLATDACFYKATSTLNYT